VHGVIDWQRRHALMRTHTALHILCGVIWNEYGKAVTGGNMEPLAARMDFEFDPLPEGFAATIEQRVNEDIEKDRLIELVKAGPRVGGGYPPSSESPLWRDVYNVLSAPLRAPRAGASKLNYEHGGSNARRLSS
jgi:hypothetical protein